MKIAYFGDKNSHTYHAARTLEIFKHLSDEDFISSGAIRECFLNVESEKCECCVVPIENSVEGTVTETLDCLIDYPLYITHEITLAIHHNLIALRDAKKEDIKIIYSHPQALAQCRKYIEKNFIGALAEAAKSTSDGIQKVTEKSVAAIGRQADNEKQNILERNIEDYKSNSTMFLALSKKPSFEGSKCSIVFDTANEPGALLKALNVLSEKKVNMTRLESRPAKTVLGRYNFFVDFERCGGKEELNNLLASLQEKTGLLKFLGKYDSQKE